MKDAHNLPVKIEELRMVYQVPFREPILGVEKVSFGIQKGDSFALLGVNGAGKSTIFKSLTNLIEPVSGSVKIMGLEVI